MEIPLIIVEKDYYIVRALRALQERIGNQFVFKGGTSLSKGWNLLGRLSEDLDLGILKEENGRLLSKRAIERRLKTAQAILEETPGLTLIGRPNSGEGEHREATFSYTAIPTPTRLLNNTVLLEIGCRGGCHPNEVRIVQSYVAKFASDTGAANIAEDLGSFEVHCLGLTRTFVEKLFAAYKVFQNREAKVRHYSDLYHLAELEEIRQFVNSPGFIDTFDDVYTCTQRYFPNQLLPPKHGIINCDAFDPDDAALAELARQYELERTLFFREPPRMTEIIGRLQRLTFYDPGA